MRVPVFPAKSPQPPVSPPISASATKTRQGFDTLDAFPLWAYQMVPVNGVRYVKVSNWYGNWVDIDNPACIAIQEVPRLAMRSGFSNTERMIAIQGLQRGIATIQFRNGPGQIPFELEVRCKTGRQVDVVFHFVTDRWANMETAFPVAGVSGWIEEANRLLTPQANLRFVVRAPFQYLDLWASESVGPEIHISNIRDNAGEEGGQFLRYCHPNAVNVFFVWNVFSMEPNGLVSVGGKVPLWGGVNWWQRPAFIGTDKSGNMARLVAHEICHVLGASDRTSGDYLMNTYYPGEAMDFNNNNTINDQY